MVELFLYLIKNKDSTKPVQLKKKKYFEPSLFLAI